MTYVYKDLKPEGLWKYFAEMNAIPRPSKHEDEIRAYCKKFGEDLGLDTVVDEIGNVIIKKPATPGMEDRKGVILQGHMDMVPQANSDTDHDFLKDPIKTYIEDGWVHAEGTTLGADNAIGVAAGMAVVAATDLEHGPVEVLITTDEEAGMTGANGIKAGYLDGDILLNLDSEDEGELYIGCAGGIDTNANFKYTEEAVPADMTPLKLSLTGLKGGHSGLDINLGRGNANLLLNKLMLNASERYGLRLADIQAGSLRNAIPREAFATVVVPTAKAENFKAFVAEFLEYAKAQLKDNDPGIELEAIVTEMPRALIDAEAQANLFEALSNVINGVVKMSEDMPGVVETSSNLAVVKSKDGIIEVCSLQRSAVDSERDRVGAEMVKIFTEAGGEAENSGSYPGWKPNVESPILAAMKEAYNNKYGKIPEVKVIHAGLECGILGAVYPHWDMISFGPTIRNPHSPDEKVNVESVEKFWDFLVDTLKNAPKK